jgi:hypothetical protein
MSTFFSSSPKIQNTTRTESAAAGAEDALHNAVLLLEPQPANHACCRLLLAKRVTIKIKGADRRLRRQPRHTPGEQRQDAQQGC